MGVLIIGIPIIVEEIFWQTNNSLHITKYVYGSYLAFFLILIGILIPLTRKLLNYFKIKKLRLLDGLITILLFLVSVVPIVILFSTIIIVLKNTDKNKPPYKFFHFICLITSVLLGVDLRFYGKLEKVQFFSVINHTSPLDYLLGCLSMNINPYTIVAGKNLFINRSSLEDKIVALLFGDIIKNYAITVDRNNKQFRNILDDDIEKESKKGKNVVIFPEGGRTKKSVLKSGILLRDFGNTIFRLAWKNNMPIQPIVFDFPVIWRGKDDDSFGIRSCRINIYYLPIIKPSDFSSINDFKNACWIAMESQLRKSKNVKRFLQ